MSMFNPIYAVQSKAGDILALTQNREYADKVAEYFGDIYEGVRVSFQELTKPGDFFGDGECAAFQVWLDKDGELVQVKEVTGTESLFSPVNKGTRTRNQCSFGHIREMKHGGRKYFEVEEVDRWNPMEYEARIKDCDFSAIVFIQKEPDETGVDPHSGYFTDMAEYEAKDARKDIMETVFCLKPEE